MDIQLALDPYAVITYIVSYVNKDETQMTKFLTEALRADAKEKAKKKLKTLKMTYLTHRQVGASEATYRVLPALKLKDSNIGCIFIMTGFPKNRSGFWKKIPEDNENTDTNVDEDENDSENEVEDEDLFVDSNELGEKIADKEGRFKQETTIHERYAARPRSSDTNIEGRLEKICLAQFASHYTPIKKLPKKADIGDDGCSKQLSWRTIFNSETRLPNYIRLSNGLHYMRLRTYPAVARIHSSKKKDGHEQYYSELVLFSPWRDEEEEFHVDSPTDCVAEYKNRQKEINANRESMYPGEATINLLEIGDWDLQKPEHLAEMLDCQGEQNNEEDMAEGCVDDPEFESFAYTGNLKADDGQDEQSKGQFEDFKYKKITLPSKKEMKHLTRKLVPEQMNVLRKVVSMCKDIKRARKNPNIEPKPMRLLLHGGAGNSLQKCQLISKGHFGFFNSPKK